MTNNTEDIVYRCKDCAKYNLCKYYHRRKETSQICHYFALPDFKSDEWCTGCKEYDTEKHCCPRFNRVIRETLNETSKPKGKWIFCGYATERDWELGIKSFKCSVCDKKGDWKSPCCPHCGVKMEVEE